MQRALSVLILCCSVIGCRSSTPATEPARVATAVVPANSTIVSTVSDASCFLFSIDLQTGQASRVTDRKNGCESGPVISSDGKRVAYSFATQDSHPSSIWIMNLDGTDHEQLTDGDDDFAPSWGPDNQTIFFLRATWFGHSSPIASSHRHGVDVYKIHSGVRLAQRVTQTNFYNVPSLSIAETADTLLLGTELEPMGGVLSEVEVESPNRARNTFQPHVPNEYKSQGQPKPIFAKAVYAASDRIVFIAASMNPKGPFDYNIYRMNGRTGSDVIQLTHREGMLEWFQLSQDRKTVTYVDNGRLHVVDIDSGKERVLLIH
jgi:Tol biopolymer transport system component